MKNKLFQIISTTLIVLLFMSGYSVSAYASDTLSGSGHRYDPYLIESVEDLCLFRDQVNAGDNYSDQYVLQTTDLDLSEIDNWIPIAQWSSGVSFNGVYNGGGHTISNLNIRDGGNAGFFSLLGGTVMNLGIESGSIEGDYVGAIASHLAPDTDAKIINCYNLATVSGIRAGGIADNFTGGSILNCWNAGTLLGDTTSGIVSYNVRSLLNCTSFDADLTSEFFNGNIDLCDSVNYSAYKISALKKEFAANTLCYCTPEEQILSTSMKGSGTESDPYRIKTVDDLCTFRILVNMGHPFHDTWVKQEANLDLAEIENWTPIGIFGQGCYFHGIYDGAGHTISNLNIDSNGNVGFFGMLSGTVMNLGIESGTIRGSFVGAITSHGSGTSAMIINCYNKATVIGTHRAGGIADNMGPGIIANCYNLGNVSAQGMVGGIASYNAARVINSHSRYLPVVDPEFNGIVENTCSQTHSLFTISSLLNKQLYKIATRTDYQHNNLYRWNTDGSFGEKQNYLSRFLLQEVLLTILVFAAIVLIYIISKCVKQNRAVSVIQIRKTLKEEYHAIIQSHDSRILFLMNSGFVFCFGMCFVALLNGDTTIIKAVFWLDTQDTYMDFFNPLTTVLNNNYAQIGHYTEIGGTYPPLARALFWIFGQLFPFTSQLMGSFNLRTNYGIIVFSLILILTSFILVSVYRKLSTKKDSMIPLFALFSSPMIFMFERGNILVFVVLLCAIFVLGYRSNVPLVRHLSYMALALAASIKIYPAALGLLLLRERNWKHIMQCVFYGVVFFVLPFVIIGPRELLLFFRNVTTSFAKNAANANAWLLNYSNTFAIIGKLFLDDATLGRTIAKYTIYPVMGMLAVSGLVTNKTWKALLAATLIIVLYPGYSVYYCAAFLTIPLLSLVAEENKGKLDYLYAVLLLLALVPLQFLCGAIGLTQAGFWTFVSFVILITAFVLIIDSFSYCFKSLMHSHK